jgi:DNA-binding IclR family transcriptional regulator
VGQHIADAAGIANPLDIGEHHIGSISLSRPLVDFREADIEPTADLLAEETTALEAELRRWTPEANPPMVEGLASTLNERISRLLTELSLSPTGVLDLPRMAAVVGARTVATRRLAEAASDFGILTPAGDVAWVAGPTLLRWSAGLGARIDIEDLVEEDLRSLSEATGETIGLALYDADKGSAAFARTFNGTHRVRYVLELGDIPLHAGAAGKAILAHLPFEPSLDLSTFTERTLTNREELVRDLERIRSRGWAIGVGERIPEAYGIAAPFFVDGAVRGSVTITIPRHRVDESLVEDLGHAVLQTCRKVTRLLSINPHNQAQLEEKAEGGALLNS